MVRNQIIDALELAENQVVEAERRKTLTVVLAGEALRALKPLVPDPLIPGKFYPPTAQHAIRQAAALAKNIEAALRGQPPQAFKFKTLGILAAIGRRTGVAEILGMRFSDVIAWWLWRCIYLSKLGFNRIWTCGFPLLSDRFFFSPLATWLLSRLVTRTGPGSRVTSRGG